MSNFAKRAAAVVETEMLDEAAGWVEWGGGPCPVAGEALVEAKLRDGHSPEFCQPAAVWSWTHHGWGSDIVKYRVVRSAADYDIAEFGATYEPILVDNSALK